MAIPRNLANLAPNVASTGKLNVAGINATGTPSGSTALLGDGTWGTVGASAATPTALGTVYGKTTTASTYFTFLGYQAGNSATSGPNTAIGYEALYSNTTGQDNTAIGAYRPLYSNTTGGDNIAIGRDALIANTTASYSIGIGRNALYSNTTGHSNTCVGYNSLFANTTGNQNVAIGYIAGDSVTTGGVNVLLGGYAGTSITTGNHNVAIGYEAGLNHTTGTGNIFLGRETRGSAVSAAQQYVIGINVIGQGDDTITIGDNGGKIYNSFKVNATWTQTSDGRLKKNIQEDALGLSFINRLRTVTYEWKASNELEQDSPYYAEVNNRTTGVVMHGLIAQEVKSALDAEGVSTFAGWDVGSDGVQSISREMFISPLIKAVQELTAQVETLKAEVAALKGN